MSAARWALPALLLGPWLAGCGGTTGATLVSFSVTAAGPADADGGALRFTSGAGAEVTLTRARLRLGALYLNQAVPLSGAAEAPCILPGIYVGSAFGPLEVDLLSPHAVAFPGPVEGTETEARTAELWLTSGDVDAAEDATPVLEVAGTASQDGGTYPFTAAVTIGSNRKARVTNPALPGAAPICRRRIVSPLPVRLTPRQGGTLTLRADPRGMFNGVDFTALTPAAPGTFLIPDTSAGPGGALYRGLMSSAGVYQLTWQD